MSLEQIRHDQSRPKFEPNQHGQDAHVTRKHQNEGNCPRSSISRWRWVHQRALPKFIG
jgi:hypothetical protein